MGEDLRNYLLDNAKPGPWIYDPSLKTDDDPRDFVKKVVVSIFLKHLTGPIPYKLVPEIQMWHYSEKMNGLRIEVSVDSKNSREHKILLGRHGSKVKKICS